MYNKLYNQIIDHAKEENRKKGSGIYYENHHIIPDFLFLNRKRNGPRGHLDGDPNCSENLVLLTFSEHLMAHYYLYEIYKGTRYEYSAGTALQFFFVKATGNHKRQIELSDIDINFLKDMEHLRVAGCESISNARKGKMPVVDAITRDVIGSVPVDHPNVLSGKWVHHSKGRSWHSTNRKTYNGSDNPNYKEMTDERKLRVFNCIINSCEDGHLKLNKLTINLKEEFTEFNKISLRWLENNLGSIDKWINEVNSTMNTDIKYDSYHRSTTQRKIASTHSSRHRWYNNGVENFRVTDEKTFCEQHPDFVRGKIKNDQN